MSAGEIYFKGQRISGKISKEMDLEVIKKCQMIFQDPMASLRGWRKSSSASASSTIRPLLITAIRSEIKRTTDKGGLYRLRGPHQPPPVQG